jgi:predicted nuclease with TOPRIM domain
VTAGELDERHQRLVARDLEIGLEAQAEAARSRADRLAAELAELQSRLERKNARIRTLTDRVAELESHRTLRDRVGSALRARRSARSTRPG